MDATTRALRALAGVTDRPLAGDEFGGTVAAAVRALLPFDGWCLVGMDPANGLRTFQFGGAGLEDARANAENEHRMPDVNQYADLARRRVPIGWLSREHPEGARSHRLRQILEPQGVRSELRMVLPSGGSAWGALVLLRDHPGRPFRDDDVRTLGPLVQPLAAAVRAFPVRRGTPRAPLRAGCLLVGPDNHIVATSEDAQSWLDDLVPGGSDQTWPQDVLRVVYDGADAVRRAAGPTTACLRTVSGRWLAVDAAPLRYGDADVCVTLRPATAGEVLEAHRRHRALTSREAEVLELAVAGHAAKQIARRLDLSVWTVNDHLGAVYRKFGVPGRDALLGQLMMR